MNTKQPGFTLIELMIVVVIIAILATIAYPSYTQFVKRSARAEAKTALLENAQFLERNFTASNSYLRDAAGNAITDASLPVKQVPRDGTAKYDIIVESDEDGEELGAASFTLQAVPRTGSAMEDDECGTLTLNHQGIKDIKDAALSKSECWDR